MRVVVDINHPGHVHYFKNFIWEMQKKGHGVLVTASEKDISYSLLDRYNIPYVKLGSYGAKISSKAFNIPLLDYRMYNAVKKFDPDIFLGFGSIRASHVAKLLRKPCVAFDDSEPSPLEHLLYVPFTDVILTPPCFKKDFGDKHLRFNGYIELSYLHKNRFRPNPDVLEGIGEKPGSKFALMRFVSWNAMHDVGKKGFDNTTKIEAVRKIEEIMPVYISSEGRLPTELEENRIRISPEKIHDILSYAHIFVGDSQTMTTEAALLGTPAVRCNTFVGKNDMGNFKELESEYGLIFNYTDPNAAICKAVELCNTADLKQEWEKKRKKILADKIDVTAFMIWFIENYPRSFMEMKEHPAVQYSCASISGDVL
ncbi:MAG: DUF354 domain-containing protein [Methanoculleus sp.]